MLVWLVLFFSVFFSFFLVLFFFSGFVFFLVLFFSLFFFPGFGFFSWFCFFLVLFFVVLFLHHRSHGEAVHHHTATKHLKADNAYSEFQQ